jgi:hypothetical protein
VIVAQPINFLYLVIFLHHPESTNCQFATDLATVPIFKRGHPVLPIANYLAHFCRLSLMYVSQLLWGLQRENLPFAPKFVSDPQ